MTMMMSKLLSHQQIETSRSKSLKKLQVDLTLLGIDIVLQCHRRHHRPSQMKIETILAVQKIV
jgi:hypothetical protein